MSISSPFASSSRLPLFQIILLAGVGLVSLGLALGLETLNAVIYYSRTGYYFLLGNLVVFVWLFCRWIKVYHWPAILENKEKYLRLLLLGVAVSAVTLGVMRVHEGWEFKIYMDEPVQAGTAYQMHKERLVSVPWRAHYVGNNLEVLNHQIDKRPALFPFLISIVHDVTGYRVENAFLTNAIITFLLLLGCYWMGCILGRAWGGVAAVALVGTVPEVVRASGGSGFEILNTTLLVYLAIFTYYFVKDRNETGASLLVYTGLLLSACRYESILAFVPIGLVILWWWWREQRIVLGWPVVVSPVFLIPYLWRHRIFSLNEDLWQLYDRPAMGSPFSLSYLGDNINAALQYWLSPLGDIPNSAFVFLLFVFALFTFLGVTLIRCRRDPSFYKTLALPAFTLVMVLAFWLFYMSYFFGQFNDFIITRLALPFYPFFAFFAVYVFMWLLDARLIRNVFLVVCAAGVIGYALPKITQARYSAGYIPAEEWRFAMEFARDQNPKETIVISRIPAVWIQYGFPSLSVNSANARIQAIKNHLAYAGSSQVYFQDLLTYNPLTGQAVSYSSSNIPESFYRLDERFIIETVAERRYDPSLIMRISRVVDVADMEATLGQPENRQDFLREATANLP